MLLFLVLATWEDRFSLSFTEQHPPDAFLAHAYGNIGKKVIKLFKAFGGNTNLITPRLLLFTLSGNRVYPRTLEGLAADQ